MSPWLNNHVDARIAFDVVLGCFVLSEWYVSVRSHFNRHGSRLRWSSLLLVLAFVYGGLVGGFVLANRAHAAEIADGRWVFFVAGLVMMCAGIIVRQWAVAVLGPFFTTDVRVRPGQTVVDTGPYRWVRHPSYTALIAIFVGIGLALGNWLALAVVAVLPSAGLVVRIRREERVLLNSLGEPYRAFAAGRARLFPGLW